MLDELIHLVLNGLIGWKVRPTRHGDLHEHESLPPFRLRLEKIIQRSQPIGNAFRVIHSLDAGAEQSISEPESLAPMRHFLFDFRTSRMLIVCGEIDAD